jgi:hypothetical protein
MGISRTAIAQRRRWDMLAYGGGGGTHTPTVVVVQFLIALGAVFLVARAMHGRK